MIRMEWVIYYNYARSHSRECALPMKKSWLRYCVKGEVVGLGGLCIAGPIHSPPVAVGSPY